MKDSRKKVLVVDVGGNHVKVLVTGQRTPRQFASGPSMTAKEMVAGVLKIAEGWEYEVVSIGYPGPVLRGKPVSEPHNLGSGWVGFDFEAAFGRPVKLLNDAAMQALGSYDGGRMLFLGLGTGLGSTMIVDGIVEPMELGHLPYRKGTYEDYIGIRGLKRVGKKKWRRYVADVVARLIAALEPDYVVVGGGNVHKLKELPPSCRAGENANAFCGGFRLWAETSGNTRDPALPKTQGKVTMTIGFDQPLYILPFDQRESFQTKVFGWEGALSAAQTAEIAAAKQVIYDGFQAAIAGGAPKKHAAILVDEQFGASILRDATRQGYMTACPAEKSGQKEFDFEYGAEFARHIEAFNPTFCKVLVRYNPEGDDEMNRRQVSRLKRLSDYLHSSGRLFMVELYVDAEPAQIRQFHGEKRAYDLDLRPTLTVQTLHELQRAGIEPDVWKVEGLDRREDCVNLVAAARREGRERVGCIILGGGQDEQKVREWLTTAANVPGLIGFAVGRTTFWDALLDWRANRIARDAAVAEISRRYREWVNIFEMAAFLPAESVPPTRQALGRWENEGGHGQATV